MDLSGKKLVFIGDSITEGVGVAVPENRFTERIAAMTGAVCLNYGISGTRIARQTAPSENPRFDLDFPSRVPELDPDADAVIVFGGTNDWGHGDAAFGTFESRDLYTFCGALHTFYTMLIEKFPTAQLVVLTPLHRAGEEAPAAAVKDGFRGSLKDYVNAIRDIAEYYAIPVLDLYKNGGMQPAVEISRELYMPDALHPNDAGHAILANKIVKFLETL